MIRGHQNSRTTMKEKIESVILLDFEKGEVIRIKFTKEELQEMKQYDEEVYHIEKAYIDPKKRIVRLQLHEYADSIDLSEFSVEDQIGIYEYLHKVFTQPKQPYEKENA